MLVHSTAALSLLTSLCLAVGPLVDVSYAKYDGTALSNGVSQWLGISYAAPPLGELRFAPPQDPLRNATTQTANRHGPVCLSIGGVPNATGFSEDCLYLDVYAPSNATTDSKLPVYFFIQGGGFNSNSNANYNGSGLVTASGFNIIVVNFNYRVGPYGFIASREIVESDTASTNNGLKDQRKAMEWIQKYITRFGGDPKMVTIGGDSAGAASVTMHLTAYGGRNDHLFQAAAAESQSFATQLTTAAELQAQNFNTPYPGAANPPLYMWNPTIDGDIICDYTYRAFAQGKFIHIPSIFGDDTNGGTVFAPRHTNTSGDSSTFLHDQFPYLTL
ncbi:hypothetical protein LTS18_010441, partial [Coniosporium uncinatum]